MSKLRELIGDSWFDLLETESNVLNSPEFYALGTFLNEEYKTNIILPERDKVFRALQLTPVDKVKVVIVGQDPYINDEADGLSFSVSETSQTVKIPPSLKAIFDEIEEDVYNGFKIEQDWNLQRWAEQGVLLLNRVLTVRHRKPKSHYNRGWEKFTDEIIRLCSNETNRKVFMLWGSEAKKLESLIDKTNHLVLKSGHPATKYYETDYWTGNRHFSQANKFLTDNYNQTISW